MSKERPLGEQARPVIAHEGPSWPGGPREIVLSGFETREMASAYKEWIESGDAHAAFGDWADSKGLE